jgi:hypothetical protein
MAFFNQIPPQIGAGGMAPGQGPNLPPALLQALQMRQRMMGPQAPPGLPGLPGGGPQPGAPPMGPGGAPPLPGAQPPGMPPGMQPGMPPGMQPPPGMQGMQPPGMSAMGGQGMGGTPGLDILKLLMAMKSKGASPMSGGVGAAPPPSLNMPYSLSANGSNTGIYDLISKIISSTGTGGGGPGGG